MQPQQQQQQQQAQLLWWPLPQLPPGMAWGGSSRVAAQQQQQQQQPQQRRPPLRVVVPHPGALLLAHINSSLAGQQQQQRPPGLPGFAWPWAQGHAVADSDAAAAAAAEAAVADAVATAQQAGDSESLPYCEVAAGPPAARAGGSDDRQQQRTCRPRSCTAQPCHELACLALMPEQQGGGGDDGSGQPKQPQQCFQPASQQEQLARAAASISTSSRAAAASERASAAGDGPPGVGAGKLLGFLGAQLLVHVANLQRSMAALQQQQQHGDAGQQQQQQQEERGPLFGAWRPRLPWQRQEGSGAGADAAAGAGRSAAPAWQAGEAARQWVARGITAEAAMALRDALACYTNAVTLCPGDPDLLCRLAKQWSDLTYEEGATVEQITEVNAKAIEYAERAITLAPKAAGGYMASCVSRGRLALFSDNKTKVRLAKEAQEAARTALALEPGNDLAHHLMGRWHYEMAQINFVVRQLIRIVYGAALAPGRFEDALSEFEAAVGLNPGKLIHRVELGRTHLRLGHRRDAYEHLSAAMALPVEDVNAKLQKEDALLLLDKLRAEFEGSVSWGGFSSSGIQQPGAAAPGGGSAASSSSVGGGGERGGGQ